MSVTAKFKVYSVTQYEHDAAKVELQAVTSGPGNESWSKWTPNGTLTMTVTNPDATAQFIPGKEYLLEFTPC